MFNVHHMIFIPKKFNLRLMRDKHGEKNTFENQKVNLTKIVIALLSRLKVPNSWIRYMYSQIKMSNKKIVKHLKTKFKIVFFFYILNSGF